MDNLAIAQAATMRPISDVASSSGLSEDDFEPLGRYKAKLSQAAVDRFRDNPKAKLVLVTAITPTPAGEGKTTTCVGLAQGLCKLGKNAVPAVREPSLGPIFGVKGGACGGGYSQVLPMEDINLFFTGDFPAIAAAHNLLSAMLDAHLYHGNALGIDPRVRVWPRTVDMNDRALREVVIGLGGKNGGVPQSDGFVITAASEVMATFGMARSLGDLKERLGSLVVGTDRKRKPIRARGLRANGAMTALLKEALRPNLVQTIEGGAALVHGGPFANIAHGCSSLVSLQAGLGMADYLITEGGFAADLGAQKFLSLVVPQLGKAPDVIVLVATVRALMHHGGDAAHPLCEGMANLDQHMAHLRSYGVPVLVAINRFMEDSDTEIAQLMTLCEDRGYRAVVSDAAGSGGAGCMGLGQAVMEEAAKPSQFVPLFDPGLPVEEKLDAIVRRAYGGQRAALSDAARKDLEWIRANGFGDLPVCVAKTQSSLSADPGLRNAPKEFEVPIRQVKVSAGAGFLVALAGEMMLMPGLGKEPAAVSIDLGEDGRIVGMY